MSNPQPVIDGVFAIHKPAGISSAQVLRDLQKHFNPSSLFQPHIDSERRRRDEESHNQSRKRSKRSRGPINVKLGHGGTLDPAATGVLIVGVGSGTKRLPDFLSCTKVYEATATFGLATDTYDMEGKIVKRAAYEGVTRDKVEDALAQFRGKIMQVPPIFSALRINGKRGYEYAREGKEIPEMKAREVTVEALELVDWMEGGSHAYAWPKTEAPREEKEVVEKVLKLETKLEEDGSAALPSDTEEPSGGEKRKRDDEVNGTVTDAPDVDAKRLKPEDEPTMSGAIPADGKVEAEPEDSGEAEPKETAPTSTTAPSSSGTCPAPAVRISMTVSSGFYVRSLCHDLGIAVGSLGFMSSLVRSRQGEFELGQNVLEYDDLDKGEDVWGPKVKEMLAQWSEKNDSVTHERNEPVARRNDNEVNGTTASRRRNTSSAE